MVQDFLIALPLSAFVLTVHVNKKVDVSVIIVLDHNVDAMLTTKL